MPRGKGKECPHCGENKYHDNGSYRECSHCGYIGWPWHMRPKEVGKGKSNECPSCEGQSLFAVKTLPDNSILRRSKICNYTAIEPPKVKVAGAH